MAKGILWVLFVALVIVVVGGVIFAAKRQGGDNTQTYAITVNADDWQKGTTGAPLTLVEYSDFQCPACASYYPVIKQLTAEFASTTLFVYRNYPLPQHKNARLAAAVAGAAGAQGKFFEMHDVIFEHQSEWAESDTAAVFFAEYARSLGLDLEKFKADLATDAVADKVTADKASGDSYNVNATPTFFLNGKKIQNPRGYEEFKAVLQAALK